MGAKKGNSQQPCTLGTHTSQLEHSSQIIREENREAVTNHATIRGWHQSSPSPRSPIPRGESLQSLCQSPGGWPALEVTFTSGHGFRLLLLGPSRFYLKIAMFLGRSEKSMDPCKPQTNKKSKHKKLGELTKESDFPYATECRCYEIRASEKAAPGRVFTRGQTKGQEA